MTYFFFYGIFKHGGFYAHQFVGCEQLGPAKAPGFVILRNTGPAAMAPGKAYGCDDTVAKGTVTGVPDDQLADMLEFLDKVESNGNSYIRVKIEVELDSGRVVEAYAYLWMEYYSQLQSDEISPNGSWYNGFKGFRHVHN
jgi:cation transport regulator ChaC